MRRALSEVMIDQLIRNPARAAEQIDSWLAKLEKANDDPRSGGEPQCWYSRLLTLATVLASSSAHRGLWVLPRVRRALEALVRAADTATGTPYEANCEDRPRDFMEGLKACYDGNRAMLRTLADLELQFRGALSKGAPATVLSLTLSQSA